MNLPTEAWGVIAKVPLAAGRISNVRRMRGSAHVKLLKSNAGEVAEWLKAAVC